MTSEKQAQKFHTNDASLLRSWYCFWLVTPHRKLDWSNQKHYPDLGSDPSSINGISALISQMPFGGETSGSVAKCWLFSQAISIQAEIQKVNIMVSSQIRDFKIQWRDHNENVKGLISETTPLHVHHAFLYISLLSLHDYDVKMPKFHILWRT